MEQEKMPVKAVLFILGAILIVGGGWWYMSKRSNCLKQIVFIPSKGETDFSSAHGEYYKLGERKHATLEEAMSVCMGF